MQTTVSTPISVDIPITNPKLPYSFGSPAPSSVLSVVYENCFLSSATLFFFKFQQVLMFHHSSDATPY